MPPNETALPRTPRRSLTRTLIHALTACTLTLGLTACTPDAPPTPPTTAPTASPAGTATTPAPKPTPTPTAVPNPAGLAPLPADDIDASFVTIENFFKAYEYGLRTGDGDPLATLFAPSCNPCTILHGYIRDIAATNTKATGGGFSMTLAELLESSRPGHVVWRIRASKGETLLEQPDGESRRLASFEGSILFELSPRGPWVISGMNAREDA